MQKIEKAIRPYLKKAVVPCFDLSNRIIHGSKAPLYAERIWINPQHCRKIMKGIDNYTGRVAKKWPPEKAKKPKDVAKDSRINSCFEHWVNGVPWEETSDYQNQLKKLSNNKQAWDGDCFSEKDLLAKYAALDEIFKQVKKEGRLKTRQELDPGNIREYGTFLIHIGPEGELFLGGGGYHRFAMALILNLDLVPAQVGCVYKESIPYLDQLREKYVT